VSDTETPRPKRIFLVFPIFQAVYPRPFQTFMEIALMAGRLHGYEFGLWSPERQPLVTAMNSVADTMTRSTYWDACIVFDDDCFPPMDVVKRLLARCFDEGHPFVAGAGVMRQYPFTTTAAKFYPEGITSVWKDNRTWLSGFEWLDQIPDELVDADFCGVPVAIIHRSCFEKMQKPWFGDQDAKGERVTHDVFFCNKLREVGIPVKVDGTIRCGHLLDPTICTFENRDLLRESIRSQKLALGEEVTT
jgi:hypothetical protein